MFGDYAKEGSISAVTWRVTFSPLLTHAEHLELARGGQVGNNSLGYLEREKSVLL